MPKKALILNKKQNEVLDLIKANWIPEEKRKGIFRISEIVSLIKNAGFEGEWWVIYKTVDRLIAAGAASKIKKAIKPVGKRNYFNEYLFYEKKINNLEINVVEVRKMNYHRKSILAVTAHDGEILAYARKRLKDIKAEKKESNRLFNQRIKETLNAIEKLSN